MLTFLANLLDWSSDNDMQLNTSKTKEMILGPLAQSHIPSLTISSGAIERVTSFKLLGLYIDSSLSWSTHVENITKKATIDYIFLNSSSELECEKHLLHFYTTVIRPILEYCAPVWHYVLTRTQAQQLKAIQKRAIHVILNLSRGMSYSSMLFAMDLESLTDRRENLSRNFFLDIV